MLGDHVRRLERRAGEHQFPVYRHRLALEHGDIELRGIFDQAKFSLRRHELGDRLVVLVGIGETGDEADRRQFQFLYLLLHRHAVIDHRSPFHFRKWYICRNARCVTSTIMFEADRVWIIKPDVEARKEATDG